MLFGLTWIDLVDILTVGAIAGLLASILMTWIIDKFYKDRLGEMHAYHVEESVEVVAIYLIATIMLCMLCGNLHGYY